MEGTNKTSASMTTNSGAGDQASYSCSDGYLMLANTTRGNFSNENSITKDGRIIPVHIFIKA